MFCGVPPLHLVSLKTAIPNPCRGKIRDKKMIPLETRSALEQENQNVLGKKETRRLHMLTRTLCNTNDRNYTNCLGILTNIVLKTQLRMI